MLNNEKILFSKQMPAELREILSNTLKSLSAPAIDVINDNSFLFTMNVASLAVYPQEVLMQIKNIVTARQISVLVTGSCLLFMACGKKAEDNDASLEVTKSPVITDVERYLAQQDIVCESGQLCPSYITKIVVVQGGKSKFCTGFLVENDTVATSSSCLTDLLRMNGQDCSKDVTFFFAKNFNRDKERIDCKQVIRATDVNIKEPTLSRSDISFLKMERPTWNRKLVGFSRAGVSQKEELKSWAVEQTDEYNGVIRKLSCEAVHKSYMNPLVTSESSPNMIFAGCEFKNGFTGAPLLFDSKVVRAVISREIDPTIINYLTSTGLLLSPLKKMFHATNMACAPTIFDADVLDEQECYKTLNFSVLDNARSELLTSTSFYSEAKKRLEAKLENNNPYLKLGVKFVTEGNSRRTKVTPRCFKKVSDWIGNFSRRTNIYSFEAELPVKNFKKGIDSYGRLQFLEEDLPTEKMNIQMSLGDLRNYGLSSILMWNNDVEWNFPDISEKCPELVLL